MLEHLQVAIACLCDLVYWVLFVNLSDFSVKQCVLPILTVFGVCFAFVLFGMYVFVLYTYKGNVLLRALSNDRWFF